MVALTPFDFCHADLSMGSHTTALLCFSLTPIIGQAKSLIRDSVISFGNGSVAYW